MISQGSSALVWSIEAAKSRCAALKQQLRDFHQAFPLRLGMSREELRSRLKLKAETFQFLLAIDSDLVQDGSLVRLINHQVTFTAEQQRQRAALLQMLESSPLMPPSLHELTTAYGGDLVHALIDLGELVRVNTDIVFTRATYESLVELVTVIIQTDGSVTVAQIRDRAGTSRKFAIALLEHLDALGWTRRQGDYRVAGPKFCPP